LKFHIIYGTTTFEILENREEEIDWGFQFLGKQGKGIIVLQQIEKLGQPL